MEMTARWALFVGGYGSGKTYGGALAFFKLCEANPGKTGFIAAPTMSLLKRNALAAFYEIAGHCIVAENHAQDERWIELSNGVVIYYGSCDRPKSLEGTNCTMIWADEAQDISYESFRVLAARLRIDGPKRQGLLTGTPKAGTWLRREFDGGKKNREMIRVNTRENIYNADDYVDEQLAFLSESLALAYVDGHWMSHSGVVYPEFNRDLHVIPYRPDPSLPVFVGVDFGFVHPAAVFAQETKKLLRYGDKVVQPGSLVVFDEDVVEHITTEGLAHRIANKFAVNGRQTLRIEWIGCDPAGASFSSSAAEQAGITDVTALRRGLKAEGLTPRIRYAHGKGSAALRSINTGIEKKRGLLLNANGETRLYYAENLLDDKTGRGIIASNESYQWNKDGTAPIKGEKADHVDHVNDSERYLERHWDSAGIRVSKLT